MNEKKEPDKPRRVPLRARTPLRTNPSTVGFSSTETQAGQTSSKTMSDGKGGALKVSQIMAQGGVTATPHTTGALPKIRTDKKGGHKPAKTSRTSDDTDESDSTHHTTDTDATSPSASPDDAAASSAPHKAPTNNAAGTANGEHKKYTLKEAGIAAHGLFESSDKDDEGKTEAEVARELEPDWGDPLPEKKKKAEPKKKSSFRRPVFNGWIPDIHGVWSMLLVPYVCGVLISHFRWQHVFLLCVWVFGYFALFAVDVWLRSGRKERYWNPVRTYAIITAGLCIILLIILPSLLEWSVVFLVLTVMGLTGPALKRRRTLVTRTVTAAAASLMLIVAYDVGTNFTRAPQTVPWLQHSAAQQPPIHTWVPYSVVVDDYAWALVMAISFFAYFWSNMFFVGSLIRRTFDRRRPMLIASVTLHVVLVAVAWVAANFQIIPIAHAVAWLLPLARAIGIPIMRRRFQTIALLRESWQKEKSGDDRPWDATEGKLQLKSPDIMFDKTPSPRNFIRILVGMEAALTLIMAVTLFL